MVRVGGIWIVNSLRCLDVRLREEIVEQVVKMCRLDTATLDQSDLILKWVHEINSKIYVGFRLFFFSMGPSGY